MDCICSFWTTPPPTPPLGNTLLTDPTTLSSDYRWIALKNEFIHLISIIAFTAIVLAGLTWATFFAPEYVVTFVLLSVVAFPPLHSVFFHPYRIEAEMFWRKNAFENLVCRKIQDITTQYTNYGAQGPQHLRYLHHKVGAKALSEAQEHYIRTTLKINDAYAGIIPLIARGLAYSELANNKLQELKEVIVRPIRPVDQQTPDTLNYRELLQKLNAATTLPEEKLSILRRITLFRAGQFRLEEEFATLQVKAAQVASIESTPSCHPGYSIGMINTFTDPASDALNEIYGNETTPLFLFHNAPTGISKTMIMQAHLSAAQTLILKVVHTLVQTRQLDLTPEQIHLENNPNPLTTQDFLQFANDLYERDPCFPHLLDNQWTQVNASVLAFINSNQLTSITQILGALKNPLLSRELLTNETLSSAFHTKAMHTIREALDKYDYNSPTAKMTRVLYTYALTPELMQQYELSTDLRIEGQTPQEILKNAGLSENFVIVRDDVIQASELLQQLAQRGVKGQNLLVHQEQRALSLAVVERNFLQAR